MDKVFRAVIFFVLTVIVTGAILCAPIMYRGYQMYAAAIKETPIEKKVEEIRGDNTYVLLDQISEDFRNGIIQSEDKRFRFHIGIDPLAILRAVKNDLIAGSFVEGGSTITQQLAKNMYFDFDKNFERKIAEAFMAFRLEWEYSKDELLELYLNCIYFGENCYGIKEASDHYYGVDPEHLSKDQSASLVYTIKCPNLYNPNAI